MPGARECNPGAPLDAVEAVAALIDGRLSPLERRVLIERLESDERLYELLIEAAKLRNISLADLLH